MSSAGSLWAEMIAQESVNEIADFLFTTATVFSAKEEGLQERGTENYLSRLVGRGRKRRYSEAQDEVGEDGKVKCEQEEGEIQEPQKKPLPPMKEYESDSDLSSGGLSDDSMAYVRKNTRAKKQTIKQRIALFKKQRIEYVQREEASNAKIRKVEVKEAMDIGDHEAGLDSINAKSEQIPQPELFVKIDVNCKGDAMEHPVAEAQTPYKVEVNCKGNVKEAPIVEAQAGTSATSYKVGQKRSWKTSHLERLEKKNDEGVAFYIIRRLGERKNFLIRNAVEILGRETCIRLFLKATKINYYGGLLIKKRNKKRTMGGIFMYLIKNDKIIPEEKKVALGEANSKMENEEKEKKHKKKFKEATGEGEKMDLMTNSIMQKMNPKSVQDSSQKKCIWNIDDNDDYSIEQVIPAPKPEEYLPKRKAIVYSDMFEF